MASASKNTTLNPCGYTLTASFNSWEESTSVSTNQSKVTCTATLKANGTYWSTSHNSTLTIYWHDNRENYNRKVASTTFAGLGGTQDSKSCSNTINVTHKDDGSLSGYAYAVFSKGDTGSAYAPNNGSVSTSWTALATIARASTPSIDGTIYTGTSCTINTNRASTSFTHVLSYTFGTKTGYIADADHKAGASCTWAIPSDFADEYGSNVTSMNCTITCDTYNGSTKIGTKTYTKAIILNTNIIPTISSATSQDGNTTIRSLSLTVYLTGKSYPELSISANGIKGSTISTYYAALNPADDTAAENNAVMGTSVSDLNTKVKNFALIAGTNIIKVWVVDSRGYKSAKTNIQLITRAYTSPTINPFNVARCKSTSDLTEDDEGTSVKISAAGSITDILASNGTTHKNTMYCKIRYKSSSSETWSSLTNLSGGVSGYSFDKTGTNSVALAGTFPTTAKYDIEIYLYDTVTLKESGWSGSGTPTDPQLAKLYKQRKSILTGFDLMHFHKSGKSVSFGKKSEAGDNNKWFEIRMAQIKFEGEIWLDGNKLLWYEEE